MQLTMFMPLTVQILALFVVANSAGKLDTLDITIVREPPHCSPRAEAGDEVTVLYTARLENGKLVDSTLDRDNPLTLVLGKGQILPGWDRGMIGMCVGELRLIQIPSHMAYWKRGNPPNIPPYADLYYETEMMHISKNASMERVLAVAKFLLIPVLGAFFIYYLYQNFQADTSKNPASMARRKKSK